MTTSEIRSGFNAIGLDPLAERVYLLLIDEGGEQNHYDLARSLDVPARQVTEAVDRLEDLLLVARSPDHPPRWSARPPAPALESLVLRRGEELARIRLYAKDLQRRFREIEHRGAADLLEVVVGDGQVLRHYAHLMETARRELAVFTMPPFVAGAPHHLDTALRGEREGIRRGVRHRAVYDSAALDEPFTLALARQSVALGEEARLTPGLPMKLLLMDGSVGFVPLHMDNPAAGSLVVRPSPLLDALISLFDLVWARAVPLTPFEDKPPSGLDERSRRILLLMANGLKDESIARALGTSRRTVQHHVSSFMQALGARTRFQAALLARERGWVEAPAPRPDGPQRSVPSNGTPPGPEQP